MAEIIHLKDGLFGPRVVTWAPSYGATTRFLISAGRFIGTVGQRTYRILSITFHAVWTLLLMVAVLPGLVIYEFFFVLFLALGFGMLHEIGKAVLLF